MTNRRKRRQATHYPVHVSLRMSEELARRINHEADAADAPVADVIRDAVVRGLPLIADARRKRRQRAQDAHAE